MIKLTDIFNAVNTLLLNLYPTYKTYGYEMSEGYSKPSFFVDLKPSAISRESVNFSKYNYIVVITYFQAAPDEVDNLQKTDEIKEAFGLRFKVCDRLIRITNFSFGFIGDNSNILQLSVEVEYFETIEKVDQHVTAKKLLLNEEER